MVKSVCKAREEKEEEHERSALQADDDFEGGADAAELVQDQTDSVVVGLPFGMGGA
ncbi:hypothetical protein [Streptomyces formicae]